MQEEVVVERRKGGTGARVVVDIGDTIDALNKQYGADVVLSHASRSIMLSLSSYVRNMIDAGKDQDEIQELAEAWKPGTKKVQKTALDKMREELDRMSPADRLVLQKELRSRVQAQAQA